ncbi:Os10g0423600 [Oryza sativa Japonica Group]|uniref:BTB/POZ domain containing protein n=3 Tax=Oryza sativa TaxID=4530 RepID=Q7XEG3_ORYSJ|nr:BTB/POZ domain containing protein [Oryza sativa Japonica Group]BAF26550.2 Os10g0423600 [Oryza sativa Japonica Group]|eukprot:NP_001064636.2 Os10g0423600 [Oryza sativa Japonica Group]
MPSSAATGGSELVWPPPPYSSASAIVGGTVTGHHILQIDGYSYTKEKLPHGKLKYSRMFNVGDHQWHLRYYPNGQGSANADYISVYLGLDAAAAGHAKEQPMKARATFSLLDRAGKPVPSYTLDAGMHDFAVGGSGFGYHQSGPALALCSRGDRRGPMMKCPKKYLFMRSNGYDGVLFFIKVMIGSKGPQNHRTGPWHQFVKRELLEKSGHVRDDGFAIRCDVTVVVELRTEDRTPPLVEVPPPDLHRHLGGLLESGDGADVTFHVAGEEVPAHRYILAARSPVFKAELFGQMKESSSSNTIVKVDDMEAEVFRALLAFIYTDALPETKTKANQEDELVIAQHLLVAADRYGMERLKLLCEEKVVEYIDRGSVATLMALAEQHHCQALKEACFRFLESKETLNAVMATDGFLHLMQSCPSLVKDLVFRVADRHFQ